MAMIVYGTHVFTKMKGYYGLKEECPYCHRAYKKAYVKYSKWWHLSYIPLIPLKKRYYKMCPICTGAIELTSREAKDQMERAYDINEPQQLEMYAKHILAKKPKGLLAHDMSYEFWVKDLITGEEICVATNLSKDRVNEIKKERGLKKLQIFDV